MSGQTNGRPPVCRLLRVAMRHDVKQFFEVLKFFSQESVYTNEQTYNLVIEACTRSKKIDKAMSYVGQMRKMRYHPKVSLSLALSRAHSLWGTRQPQLDRC
jgi:pentatricopeptide repeat protein